MLTLATFMTVPTLIAATTSLFAHADTALIVSCVCFALALMLASLLVRSNTWWTVAAGLAAALATAFSVIAAPEAVLDARGDRITATVVEHRVATYRLRGSQRYDHYVLARPDGVRIPGELVESYGHHTIGDRIDVLVDPSGRVDPRPASTVDGAASLLLLVPWLMLIAAVLCVPAVTTRPRADADGMFSPT